MSVLGQAVSWAGTTGCCSINKCSLPCTGFAGDRQDKDPRTCRNPGEPPQVATLTDFKPVMPTSSGVETHLHLLKSGFQMQKGTDAGKGVLFPRKPGEKSPFTRSGAGGSGSGGDWGRDRGGATKGHRCAAGRGQDFIDGQDFWGACSRTDWRPGLGVLALPSRTLRSFQEV